MSSDDPGSFDGRVYDPDVDAGGEDLTADQKEQLKAALDDIAAGSEELADDIDEPEELDTEGALVASEGEDAARAAVSAQIPQHAEPKTREIGKIAPGPVDRSRRAVTARIERPAAEPDEEQDGAMASSGGDHRAKIAVAVVVLAVAAGIAWAMRPSAPTESRSTSTASSAPAASVATPSRSALVVTDSRPTTSASTAAGSSASTTHSLATSAPETTTAPTATTTTPTAKHTTTRVSPTTKPATSKPAAKTTTSPWGTLGDD